MVVGENGAAGIPALHLVKAELETENVFVISLSPNLNTAEKTALLMGLQILKPNNVTSIDALVK